MPQLICPTNWLSFGHRASEPEQSAKRNPYSSRTQASSSVAPATNDAGQTRTTASLSERAKFVLARTARQLPVACLNVALNYSFQAVPLKLLNESAVAQKVLPWVSLSGHTGVSISKELVGALADLFGSRITLQPSASKWWPYGMQGTIAQVAGGILDGACYLGGVMISSNASPQIRNAHGVGDTVGADASQALMKVLKDLGNGELGALLAPNGACDWGHRISEAFVIACMPEAEYSYKMFRKPEWQDFAVRVGIGLGVRIGVTGLCSTGWLSAIASENQAGYMVAGAYSAVVPAALRVVQPVIRDVLYQQLYLNPKYRKQQRQEIENSAVVHGSDPAALPPAEAGDETPRETGDLADFGRHSRVYERNALELPRFGSDNNALLSHAPRVRAGEDGFGDLIEPDAPGMGALGEMLSTEVTKRTFGPAQDGPPSRYRLHIRRPYDFDQGREVRNAGEQRVDD